MNEYELKQEARRARLEARAARLERQGNSRIDGARANAEMIPFGQPILIGHHSEKRDRNFRAKIESGFRKGLETLKEAGEARAKAEAVGTGGISSDDPDAIAKLQEQLEDLRKLQDAMKAKNVAWRKAGNKAGRQADGTWVEPPIASYQLTNNSANIRRIEQRIEHLKRTAQRQTSEKTVGEIRIVQNAEENRMQIFFPGKPAPAVIAECKARGFRWAPSCGAWQRQLSNAAIWGAECIVKAANGEPE